MSSQSNMADSPGSDRRRAPRFPFVANAEIVDAGTGASLFARTTALSLFGCFLDLSQPLPCGSHVIVRIFTETDFFEAAATIKFSQPRIGVGLAFRDVNPRFLPVLKKWLHAAMKKLSCKELSTPKTTAGCPPSRTR